MRFLRRSLSGLFLAALTLAMLAITLQGVFQAAQTRLGSEPARVAERERVFAVDVIVARPRVIEPVLETFGEVRSRRTLEVRATSAGTVVGLSDAFVEGGRVSEGDLLVQIDPRDAQSDYDMAENALFGAETDLRDAERALTLARAELKVAESQVELRENRLQRDLDLANQGIGTVAAAEAAEIALVQAQQSVVTSQAAVAQSEARVESALGALERTKIELADAERAMAETEIRAKFGGTLSDVSAVVGGLVGRNERLASLIDAEKLEVQFRVSTGQYARLIGPDGALLDLPMTIALDAAGIKLSADGRLDRVSAAVAEGQSGRLIFADLDSAPEFRPGDFVVVRVTEPRVENVVRIPASAYGSDGMVLSVGNDDRLETLPVDLVRRQNDDVLVRAPDLRGKRIVTERTPVLGPGIRVRAIAPRGALGASEADEAGLIRPSDGQRGKLAAFIEDKAPPDDIKREIMARLSRSKFPAEMVERVKGRPGG